MINIENATENVHKKIEIIKKNDTAIHAFIEIYENDAIERAKEIDKKIKKGNGGKLAGLVIAVKNNIAVKGKKLTCASKMLEQHTATYNATVIERLINEDAVIIGSTNLDEFACGSDTTHSAFFSTKNPTDTSRVPGGSSGGSGAAVAADMCDAAIGSDTGGSIRCPAAFCRVFGFKPTYGAVSRYGLVDMAMSLDQIGPLSKDKETTKLLFDVIKGKDPKDPTTSLFEEKKGTVKSIGVPKEFFEGVQTDIAKSVKIKIKELEKKYEIVEISLPSVKYSIPIYYLLMAAEFSSGMQKYDGLRYGSPADRTRELYNSFQTIRGATFGKEVKRRIMLGTYITMKEFREAWYTQTLRARKLLQSEFNKALQKVDVIAGPAMPTEAWKFGEKMDPVEMYSADILTVSANLAGLPALVEPLEHGAFQIHGRHFEDSTLFNL
mgnify:CR=1 FL=1